MTLKISLERTLPLKFLSLRKVVFGGSGSGKTSFGRVLFEEATSAGVLCGAIDLKGDFWGLKSTADGQGDGIPIVIFGGEHQDVPLDENGGTSLAEIVVELRQPFVVDLENLSKGKQLRFLGAFFERLYDKNREPLVLFCDEADRYAPQKPMSPEANICLGAAEDIAKSGRKHGIFPVFITQRNASLNKGVSELCDVAIVFRTPGPRDQEAVEDWFGTKATREQRDEVMTKLAGLPTGTSVICSAHPDLKLFATVGIRQPTTFDSSATPEIGKRRIEPKQLAKPDLDKIQSRMAATIEKAKAEDPRELRRRIAELEAIVKKSRQSVDHSQHIVGKTQRVEVPVLKDAQVKRLEVIFHGAEKLQERTAVALGEVVKAAWAAREAMRAHQQPQNMQKHEIAGNRMLPARKVAVSPQESGKFPQRKAPPATVSPGVDGPQQRILDTIAMLNVRGLALSRETIARWMTLHPNGGRYNRGLAALRADGYLDGFQLTDLGHKVSHVPAETGPAGALAALPDETKRRLLGTILDVGHALSREDLAAKLGLHPNGGRFNRDLAWLRTMGVIPERGLIAPTEGVFR